MFDFLKVSVEHKPVLSIIIAMFIAMMPSVLLWVKGFLRDKKEYQRRASDFILVSNLNENASLKKIKNSHNYFSRAMDEAEDRINTYVSILIKNFQSDLTFLLEKRDHQVPAGVTCIGLPIYERINYYSLIYKTLFFEAFEKVKRKLVKELQTEKFSDYENGHWVNYKRTRTESFFKDVKDYLIKYYNNDIMPLSLEERFNKIDERDIYDLGDSIFEWFRQCYKAYVKANQEVDEEKSKQIEELIRRTI